MVSALLRLKGQTVEIACLTGDGEGCKYASEFKEIFNASGRTVKGVSQVVYSKPFLGIQIQFVGENPTQPATYVADLLKRLGLYSDTYLYRTKDNLTAHSACLSVPKAKHILLPSVAIGSQSIWKRKSFIKKAI